MPQIIEVPGHGRIEFPDGMSDAQITAAIQRDIAPKGLQPSQLAEAGRVADKTIRGGLLAVPQIMEMGMKGAEWLGNKGAEAITGEPVPPAPEQSSLMKVLSMRRPAEGLTELTGGPVSEPQTSAGQAIGNVGQATVGALAGPGGFTQPIRSGAIGLSGGLGSEVAARFLGDNALSRLGGGLAAGGTTGLLTAGIPNKDKLIRQAVSQVPEGDWRRAKAVEKVLYGLGISHLKSQLLGPSSTLDDLATVAASHPSVRPKLLAAVKNSPEEARRSFELWSSQNLPPNVGSRREVLDDVQGMATKSIQNLRDQAGREYAGNLQPGVDSETYSSDFINNMRKELQDFVKDPSWLGPLSRGGQDIKKFLSSHLPKLKDGEDIPKGYINGLVKDLNSIGEKEGFSGVAVNKIKEVLKSYTQDDFGAARQAMSDFIKTNVDPVKKGLTGQLADMGGGIRPDKSTARETALKLVFPDNSAQPNEIIQMGKDMGADSIGQLLKEHLTKSMDAASKLRLSDAQSLQAPANFVQAIAGTPAQRKNLEAALHVVATGNGVNPYAVRNGFYKLIRAMETTKDLRLPTSVDRTVLAQQAGVNAPGLIVAPQSRLGRFFTDKMTEKTYKQIADVLIAKDGLKQLERIARAKDPSAVSTLARSLWSSVDESESETPAETPAN